MPSLGAMAVIMCNGQVLLIKRSDVEVWALPAGGVEPGESVAQAAAREVKEETGIEVELSRLVGIYSSPNWSSGGDHSALFYGSPVGGELTPQEGETTDVGYFDPASLPEPFVWWHRRRLSDAIQGAEGVAVVQDRVWTLPQDITYQEIQDKRRREGLSRFEFFEKYLTEVSDSGEYVEVPKVAPE